ncbi:MAG: hypothetical protein RBT38_02395 [Bacteroidales bacterium]|jgi:dimethylargininase|nr:hypothetical protein [Bacteroidales bacterium]
MESSFKNAIVRKPSRSITRGLSSSGLGIPVWEISISQHSEYTKALVSCGLSAEILKPDEEFPDSTFIEDVALCTPACAIITSPGAPSRRDETRGMRKILAGYYAKIEEIVPPATLEAGDVMMADGHFFIGLSGRTNASGARQLTAILRKYGFTASCVPIESLLHLKSGASYLGNGNMLVTSELTKRDEFEGYNRISVPKKENYAANSLWLNGRVLVPEGFPETRDLIENAGYPTITVDVSEFRKVDGGLSCLSLRF